VNVVWSNDLRDFAIPLLGRDWDLHEGEDYPSQNSYRDFTIPDEDRYWEEDGANFQRWLDGGELYEDFTAEPSCAMVMEWLYEQGHIPAGKYGVEVWW
jgi:hypothetical protein